MITWNEALCWILFHSNAASNLHVVDRSKWLFWRVSAGYLHLDRPLQTASNLVLPWESPADAKCPLCVSHRLSKPYFRILLSLGLLSKAGVLVAFLMWLRFGMLSASCRFTCAARTLVKGYSHVIRIEIVCCRYVLNYIWWSLRIKVMPTVRSESDRVIRQ